MQATNGSAVSPRKGRRLAGYVGVLALALSGLVFAPAAANATTPTPTTYLALGDSAGFGYTQERFAVNYPNEAPSYFEEGFANGFAKLLGRSTEAGKGVTLVNDACPNETVDGLIGHNLPGGGAGSEYEPCPYHNLDGFALHNSLGAQSQLEEALSVLKEGSPAHHIDAITISIGMSDQLAAIKQCETEVGTEEAVLKACVEGADSNIVQPRTIEGVEDIIGVLDSTEPGGGHYTGPIIVVGYYNPDSFVLPGTDQLVKGLNTAFETELVGKFPNVTYANPFPTFNKGAAKSAQEQTAICKNTEMCNPNVQVGGSPAGKDGDPSPSAAGGKALAKIVNEAYLRNPGLGH